MSSSSIYTFPSPAKLNLCLKIIGRAEDGYHNLHTVFQFLNLHDTLYFSLRSDLEICLKSDVSNSVPNDENLIMRAAQILQSRALELGKEIPQGVEIQLDKRLPVGGGVGGGSSNAATTLLVLNRLWSLDLSKRELSELGLCLGADVPVFVEGKASIAEGKGERLNTLEIPEFFYVLLKPKCHASTARIFQHQELTRDSSPRTIRAFLAGGKSFQSLEELIQIGNDCENLVRKLYPEVDRAIESLSEFSKAQLTGTGACVFAPFETHALAENAAETLQANSSNGQWLEEALVVKGVNESPLHRALTEL